MHRRVRLLGGRKGRFSPLTSALRHCPRNAFPSQRLPAARRFQSVPSATYPTRLRHYAMKSRRISPRHSSDVHAAPNLDQPKKAEYMFDAVGLASQAVGNATRYGGSMECLDISRHRGCDRLKACLETGAATDFPGNMRTRDRPA